MSVNGDGEAGADGTGDSGRRSHFCGAHRGGAAPGMIKFAAP